MYCISCGRQLKYDPMLSTYLSPNVTGIIQQQIGKTEAAKYDVVHCPFCGTKYYVESVNRKPLWADRFHSMAYMNNRDGELHLTEESLIFVEAYTLKQTVFQLNRIYHPAADDQHLSFWYRDFEEPIHILVYEEYGPTWAAKIAEACGRCRENV